MERKLSKLRVMLRLLYRGLSPRKGCRKSKDGQNSADSQKLEVDAGSICSDCEIHFSVTWQQWPYSSKVFFLNSCLSWVKQISLFVGGRPLMYKASNISRWHFSQKDDKSRSRAKYYYARKLTFFFLNYRRRELKRGSGKVIF